MTTPGALRVAFFAMPERGHFQPMLPVLAGLVGHCIAATFYTAATFRPDVHAAGGTFVDLFARHPLDQADAESIPIPCRYVSFAGAYAEQIAAEVRESRPDLVVYETFSVIGWLVAQMLGIPYVHVCAGHNVHPARFRAELETDPRVAVGPACWQAVDVLRHRYGVEDASPFSYVSAPSPFLNLYCEPPAFLDVNARPAFEPLAFFGSLPSLAEQPAGANGRLSRSVADRRQLKLFVSFGTVVWRYWRAEAFAALHAISGALADMPEVEGLLAVQGGQLAPEERRSLERPNVVVAEDPPQWDVLREADVFLTHHGPASTHEAIFHRVPMISYPFFWDQPGLAQTCQRLGLAVPLVDRPRAPVSEGHLRAALASIRERRDVIVERLSAVREWELEVIAQRDSVLRRVAALARSRG